MNILVTGGAGFIGNHLALRFAEDGHKVVSVDNLSVKDEKLQKERLKRLDGKVENHQIDIVNYEDLEKVFAKNKFDVVYHLAAKAGVRESIENPFIYAKSNYIGTLNVFELSKKHNVSHVIFASSSSVYGRNSKLPFSEEDRVDNPISVYASSKRACELLAYTYCDLFDMNITCLRFFTVYGPYGRPDMAPYIFTNKIINGETIKIFNKGNQRRDFTFVNDIIKGCVGVMPHKKGHNVINLGNGNPVELMDFISTIESILGVEATKEFVEAQKGDVQETHADVSKAKSLFNYNPEVNISDGMKEFISWYRTYHNV